MEIKDLLSRRDFGRLAIAAVPLSLALARADSKVNGVRIGVQSYSFRTLALDDAIKAMSEIGLGEVELFSGHVEPRPSFSFGGPGGERPSPEAMKAYREDVRKFRLSTPLDHFAWSSTDWAPIRHRSSTANCDARTPRCSGRRVAPTRHVWSSISTFISTRGRCAGSDPRFMRRLADRAVRSTGLAASLSASPLAATCSTSSSPSNIWSSGSVSARRPKR